MKKNIKLISILLVLVLLVCLLAACGENGDDNNNGDDKPPTNLDYADDIVFNPSSTEYACKEVTVHMFIDGDTTHFEVSNTQGMPEGVQATGIIKARYIAVNTPESTGKIEDYGHMASRYTKEKLSNAQKIYIESDTKNWDADSTGDRYVLWIWYLPEGESTYRNLNIELLQEGLAIASDTGGNRYGKIATAALQQAKSNKLFVHSNVPDPELYRGDAYQITIAELIGNLEYYKNKVVVVDGIITQDFDQKVYFESYDEDLDMVVGFNAYYGFNASADLLRILKIGNHVRFAGTVQEFNGTYQISGLQVQSLFDPDPTAAVCTLLEENAGSANYQKITASQFTTGKVTYDVFADVDDQEGGKTSVTLDWANLALNTTVSMDNLYVEKVYTTDNGGDSDGAMTLTCKVNGITVSVRTEVLVQDGAVVTDDAYKGKTINVKGIVDFFSGKYQIKVFSADDIVVL